MTFSLKKFASKEGVSYVMRNGQRIAVKTLEEPPGLAAKTRKRQRGKEEEFVKLMGWWAARAGEDAKQEEVLLCYELLRRAWKKPGESFVLPNRKGVSRKLRYRALRNYERAGMLKVEWRRGKSPIITLEPPT
jgi:hypothetical protein